MPDSLKKVVLIKNGDGGVVVGRGAVYKAGFPLGVIFRAQRKAYCFSSNSAISVR